MSVRKIGGIWWFKVGRMRFAFCVVNENKTANTVARVAVMQELREKGVKLSLVGGAEINKVARELVHGTSK